MAVKGSCCVIDCSGLLDFNVLVPRESDVGFTCQMTRFLFNFSFQ